MRIGVFGGSFNPIHMGHVNAAITSVSENKLDLLIVVPTGTAPHKELPKNSPDPKIRLEMVKSAFINHKNVIVSELEIFKSELCYTVDTIKILSNEYPNSEFFLLLGDDMFDSLNNHQWKDSELLLTLVTPILLSRHVLDISSTELREMFPNRDGNEYLADSTYSLIIKHRFYDAKPNWNWLRKKAYSMLNHERIPHVSACEREAIALAELWNADVDDAREAALLHDITKKLDLNENLCIISEHGESVGELKKGEDKLLHAVTGSLLAKSMFGMSQKITEAIRWHTTGKINMTLLDKIIYLADYTEATRDFSQVQLLREKAKTNIDDAMIMGLELTVLDLLERGLSPSKDTYGALYSLVKK